MIHNSLILVGSGDFDEYEVRLEQSIEVDGELERDGSKIQSHCQ